MSNLYVYTCNYCGKIFTDLKEKDRHVAEYHDPFFKQPVYSTEIQVDGDHYKNLAIQPAVYSYKNKLGWHEGEIIKYVTRHRNKNGKIDLEKARHLIDMLIELEYDSS